MVCTTVLGHLYVFFILFSSLFKKLNKNYYLKFPLKTICDKVKLICFRIFLLFTLILSGDVETNPGPKKETFSQNCFSIFHQNIRSIRNKINFINDYWLEYDILCFTETHLSNELSNTSISLDGFSNMYRKDGNSYSGGIAIYVSDNFICKRVFDLEMLLNESIWVEIRKSNESFLVCATYRPPNYDNDYWRSMNLSVEKAFEVSQNIIILGDINEDQLNVNNKKIRNILLLNGLQNIINNPTRVTDRSSTLLDPIAISNNVKILNSGIYLTPKQISDHYGTYIYIQSSEKPVTPYKRRVWNYKRADFFKLNELITAKDWSFLNSYSIDEACLLFTNLFLDLAMQCIPTNLVTVRPNDKPWYDSAIRNMTRKKDRQKHKASLSKKEFDWLIFKQMRNKTSNMIKHAKEKFYNNLEYSITNINSNNPRQYWKTVKMLLKEKRVCEYIPPLCIESSSNNSYYFTDLEKANCLNGYFVSISTIDDHEIPLPNFTEKTDATLTNLQVQDQEIIDILTSLIVNKASGPDEISHRMLKETRFSICVPLRILFNKSFLDNTYPETWKSAVVMPIYKKGNKNEPMNYRPISLISCIGKVSERIVFKHVYNHLHFNNLIYPKQSGFLPGHSTVYQLIDIYHQITQAFDKKQSTCMVFCDISKAFDRVWHKGLVFKLSKYGIKGDLLNWMTNYLTNRKQKVFVNSSFSSESVLTAGIPQGSGSMQTLTFKLKRKTLNQIYISYMRPILEYASTVWDGCNENEKKISRKNAV